MKLDHIAINVENIQESISWYIKNFSATVDYQDATWAMLLIAGTKLALTKKSQHPPHIAFTIDKDILLENFKTHRDKSKYIYKSDPDGNIIEILQYPGDKDGI